jgi:hypothetical protein
VGGYAAVARSSDIVLNFQGFGASPTARYVQNNTTTSDGSDFMHSLNVGTRGNPRKTNLVLLPTSEKREA